MTLQDITLRLVAAALLSGAIGLERQLRGKPAGFRTNSLVGLGSAAMTLAGLMIAEAYPGSDPTRIASVVVQGIGFIGAGAILQAGGAVHGLTTSATLWAVAGIGIAIGFGLWEIALISTALVLVMLVIFGPLDAKLEETTEKGMWLFRKKQ